MPPTRPWYLFGVASLIICIAVGAFAHTGATGVVKQRMDDMKSIAGAMKAIAGMLKGKAPYDAAMVRALSLSISNRGGAKLLALYPANSLDPPSTSTPRIWAEWKRFSAIAQTLSASAKALADGAAGPRGASVAGSPEQLFQSVAATCKACHGSFRTRK